MTDSATPVPEDFRGVDVIRPVYHPESYILWNKHVAAAKDGRMAPFICDHPTRAVNQIIDDVATERDRYMRPTNLFECGQCHALLTLVDPFGNRAADA